MATPATQVEPRLERLLVPPYIREEVVTLVASPGGNCKSTFSLYVAANFTRGINPFTGEHGGAPGDVLLCLREDGVGRQRFFLNGFDADISRVHFSSVRYLQPDTDKPTKDMKLLHAEIRHHKVKLVIFDPFAKIVGAGPKRVDLVFDFLQDIAEKRRLAILILAHSVKRIRKLDEDWLAGTGRLSQVIRAGYYLAKLDDETRLLLPMKENYSKSRAWHFRVRFDGDHRRIVPIGFDDASNFFPAKDDGDADDE